MSHFLWIEDFDGVEAKRLSRNVFSEILSDFYSIKNTGIDETNNVIFKKLEKNDIYIEENFEKGLKYIRNNLSKIDYIILDINLPITRKESAEAKEFLNRFYDYNDNKDGTTNIDLLNKKCEEFRLNSGFYLFTELVCEFGFPKNHIIFYSNHGNDEDTIKINFKKAGITLPDIYLKDYEKNEEDYEKGEKDQKIRKWVKDCYENPYSRLRRGIIEACGDDGLKKLAKDENNLQINDYAKDKISSTDIINYLDTLSQLLPIREPDDLNLKYRIFLRTLAHEWDVCNIPNEYRRGEKHSASTFVEIMTKVRNWVAHDKLLEQHWVTPDKLLKELNEEIISFLFMVNMRAMFRLDNNVQKYELKLLNCISTSPFPDAINDQKIIKAEEYVDDLLLNNMTNVRLDNNIYSRDYLDKKGNPRTDKFDKKYFNLKINCLHNEKKNINLKYGYQQLLLQYFFVSHLKNNSDWLKNIRNIQEGEEFLPTLARHIYHRSFTEV
jgi:hypothetical protein